MLTTSPTLCIEFFAPDISDFYIPWHGSTISR